MPALVELQAEFEAIRRFEKWAADDAPRHFQAERANRRKKARKNIAAARKHSVGSAERAALRSEALSLLRDAAELSVLGHEWPRDARRTIVLRLVTACEVFLRQTLIEKAVANRPAVASFLKSKTGLQTATPVHLGATAAEAEERIADCVDKTCETFSAFGDTANGHFANWFGKGYRTLEPGTSWAPFSDKDDKRSAMSDLDILFQLRHILVHKGGNTNTKYHDELAKVATRLDPKACSGPPFPPPDDILRSPSMDGSRNKLEDFYRSLDRFAQHVDQLFP